MPDFFDEPPKFSLGRVFITEDAESVLSIVDVGIFLQWHENSHWGDVHENDRRANEEALHHNRGKLTSVYHSRDGIKFWIVTELDRSVTTVLLPEDY